MRRPINLSVQRCIRFPRIYVLFRRNSKNISTDEPLFMQQNIQLLHYFSNIIRFIIGQKYVHVKILSSVFKTNTGNKTHLK